MGAGGSSYKLAVGSTPYNKNLDWVAAPTAKILPMKAEGFINILGLGKGKFGLVFLAKQAARESSLHVAIKYIPKQTIFEFQNAGRLQQEIQALQQCDHPFIIHCFGGFDTPTCIALVLEFAYGGELYHRLQQVHKMSENEAKFYFCELASALRYLHDELGIVYRDLKPENIMLDKEGHVRLCDFGFACAIDPNQPGGPAPLQDGCGTVMYMAPELVGKSLKASHSFPVDWWALGCVLVELITGEAPFGNSEHMSKFEIFNRISESPVRLPLLMSGSLKALIKGLLDKSDAKRFSFDQVSQSAWLKEVNWDDLEARRIRPPWVPQADTPTVSAANFISWDKLALPTGNLASGAISYSKDIKLPVPRSSNKIYGAAKKGGPSSSSGGAGDAKGGAGAPGRMGRQNSRKVLVENGAAEEGSALDSPGNAAAKRRPDSIMVAKERSKGRVATDSGETGAKTTDSVKLQRERSKANLKKEHSTIKE